MICSRCGADKAPCLFTPFHVKKISIGYVGYCRKCTAELHGQVPFGVKEKREGGRKGAALIKKYERAMDQRSVSKAIVDKQETKRLLSLRESRLHPVR